MTMHDIEVATARAEGIVRRDRVFRWVAVAVACVAMMLAGVGLIIVAQRAEYNAGAIDRTDDRAQVADNKADTAADDAAATRLTLDDIVRVLKQKKIVKDGRNGLQGSTGPRGNTGPRGLPGPTGPRGATGPRGSDGRNAVLTRTDLVAGIEAMCMIRNCRGPQGERGPQGTQGAPGPAGPQGPPMSDAFSVTFPRSDGSTATLSCTTTAPNTYHCTPSTA